MSINNFFNFADDDDKHCDFLSYLVSFAMEQHKDEDPLLSECAKELIRYILQIEQDEEVIVTIPEERKYMNQGIFVINHNKCIEIKARPWNRHLEMECYHVLFNPFAGSPTYKFEYSHIENSHITNLSIKKLKEICGKYKSENPIFIQFLQFLDEQERAIQARLQQPIEQWNDNDYRHFVLRLIENSILDITPIKNGYELYFKNTHINS